MKKYNSLKQVVESIENRGQHALDSIQINLERASKNRDKKNKPWVLLLGPHGSGKTTLLAESGIEFSSPTHKTLNKITQTQHVDCWFSDHAVFIDPSAKYGFCDVNHPNHPIAWQHFLENLAKNRQPLFDSVCLVIDLPTLSQNNDAAFNLLIERWRTQLALLATYCSPVQLHLIITQCDHMCGFTEFFSTLNKEQRDEPFGLSLIDEENKTYILDLFAERYQHFIKALNLRLCKRLHQEPVLLKRSRVFDIAFQFEMLAEPLQRLLLTLDGYTNIRLNNIMFCAAKQSTYTHAVYDNKLQQAFNITPQHHLPFITEQHPLFVKGLIPKITQPFNPTLTPQHKVTKKRWHLLSYPLTVAIICAFTGVLHHLYQANIKVIRHATLKLGTLNHKNWLSEMDLLTQTKNELNQRSSFLSTLVGFNDISKLQSKINTVLKHDIKVKFIGSLEKILENEIKIECNNNSPALYNTLRAYIMLGDKSKFDSTFLQKWFHSFWEKQLPHDKSTQKYLQSLLNTALTLKQRDGHQDQDLIAHAQNILQKQPLGDIGFRILRNEASTQRIAITNIPSIKGIDLNTARIPKFYSKSQFKTIYQQKIPALAKSIVQGNWVIGKRNHSDKTQKELISEIQARYVQHYLASWENTLEQIRFIKPTTFEDAAQQINLLTNPQSPLWQIYQQALNDAKNAGAPVSKDHLSNFIPGHTLAAPMVEALTKLQGTLSTIQNSPAAAKAAYDFSKLHFSTKNNPDTLTQVLQAANTQPTPVKSWMKKIALNSWGLVLDQTRIYLNTLWKAQVTSEYNAKIKDRYPVFKEKDKEISVDDFNQFFGPGGTVELFFTAYLMPFIDLSHSHWTWKKSDNLSLGIPQKTLDMLMRASMIQKIFYTEDSAKPSFKFTLAPISLSQNSNKFILNIGGEMVQYAPHLNNSTLITWPGPSGDFVTMRFNNPNEANPTLTTQGPWAWLHLLDHAQLFSSTDPRIYKVIFSLKDNQATYQITTNNPANLFLPHVLSGFRCPTFL